MENIAFYIVDKLFATGLVLLVMLIAKSVAAGLVRNVLAAHYNGSIEIRFFGVVFRLKWTQNKADDRIPNHQPRPAKPVTPMLKTVNVEIIPGESHRNLAKLFNLISKSIGG